MATGASSACVVHICGLPGAGTARLLRVAPAAGLLDRRAKRTAKRADGAAQVVQEDERGAGGAGGVQVACVGGQELVA